MGQALPGLALLSFIVGWKAYLMPTWELKRFRGEVGYTVLSEKLSCKWSGINFVRSTSPLKIFKWFQWSILPVFHI